jgi:hypothetical protein
MADFATTASQNGDEGNKQFNIFTKFRKILFSYEGKAHKIITCFVTYAFQETTVK